MSRRSIFNFPAVYNQFLARSWKINLHQPSYHLINITSCNMYSHTKHKTVAHHLFMYNQMKPGPVHDGWEFSSLKFKPNVRDLSNSGKKTALSSPEEHWDKDALLLRSGCFWGLYKCIIDRIIA